MNWTDSLPILPTFPAMFAAEPGAEPAKPRYHVQRAGVGVWTTAYLRHPCRDPRYATFCRWKADPAGQGAFLDTAAAALVDLIKAWCPVLPSDWIVTAPPAGASEGGMYPAGTLAREVAARLALDFQTTLRRTDSKRHHHPAESRQQQPYTVAVVPPAVVLILDDFISSGTTMRLSREALAAVGVPSFAFAWGTD
jgi:hypothetical protein